MSQSYLLGGRQQSGLSLSVLQQTVDITDCWLVDIWLSRRCRSHRWMRTAAQCRRMTLLTLSPAAGNDRSFCQTQQARDSDMEAMLFTALSICFVGFCGQPQYCYRPTVQKSQGLCRANLHKWDLTQSPSSDCGQ